MEIHIIIIIIASLFIFLNILAVLSVLFCHIRKGIFNREMHPFNPHIDDNERFKEFWKGIEWYKTNGEWISCKMIDGISLKAKLFINPNAKFNLIMVHGYRGIPEMNFCSMFNWVKTLNANIIFITQRAHKPNDGNILYLGNKEKDDIYQWYKLVSDMNNLPIYLFGVSMGTTAILLSLEYNYDSRLKGIIADCGFTSIDSVYKFQLMSKLGHTLGYISLLLCRFWTLVIFRIKTKKYDCIKTINKTDVPIIFVHCKKDNVVSYKDTLKVFNKYNGQKIMLLSKEGGHIDYFNLHKENYIKTIKKMFKDFD